MEEFANWLDLGNKIKIDLHNSSTCDATFRIQEEGTKVSLEGS
jgi:hypothetical protein